AERLGRPTILALTATASPPVRREIVERLGMSDPAEVIRGFDRPNLHFAVRRFTAAGVKAEAYHAGLPAKHRGELQDRFMADEVEVIVATTAFGMGIDKPNV